MNYTEYLDNPIPCSLCNKNLTWHESCTTANFGRCDLCILKAVATIGSKRKKEVFRPDEIPHLFVHQIKEHARTSSGNLSFSGPNYKSYTTVIASRVVNRKGEVAFLIDINRYSMTTGKQIDGLRRAIPDGTKVMRVYRSDVDNGREYAPIDPKDHTKGYEFRDKKDGRTPDHKCNLQHWTDEVETKLTTAAKSREPKKSRLMGEASSIVDKMREYATFFAIPKVKYPKLPASKDELATMQAANIKREAIATAKAIKARELENARLKAESVIDRERWITGESNGVYSWSSYHDTELRIVGNEVETSRGARFPLAHAKRGLALVESAIARGEEWRRNGQTCHLGHYQIDRIEANGTVHAGCHVVPFTAILRIRESIVSSIVVNDEAEVA